jgi:uncharacterized protein (UPF0297 family)
MDETMQFQFDVDRSQLVRQIMSEVYQALKEKGYDPVSQIVGYIISGDPTYITGHKNARHMIRRLERDEIMEELVRFYLFSLDKK